MTPATGTTGHGQRDQRAVARALERASAEPALAVPALLAGRGLEVTPAGHGQRGDLLVLRRRLAQRQSARLPAAWSVAAMTGWAAQRHGEVLPPGRASESPMVPSLPDYLALTIAAYSWRARA